MLRTSCLVVACCSFFACSQTNPLERDLPEVKPTGGAQTVFAGQITTDNFEAERIAGPASQGRPGDYYLRNDQVRLIVQAPSQNVGPCAFGGNLIDFDRVGSPAGDQLGEISPFMQLGRSFNFDRAEIVADGSKGGPAAVRFFGHDAKIDYIDILKLGAVTGIIPEEIAADVKLGLEAAVTYILDPGETKVRVVYTIYNPSPNKLATSWGTLADTGASIEVFHPYSGYGEIGFGDILADDGAPPTTFVAYQGVGLAYGIMPLYADLMKGGTGLTVAGVNVELHDLARRIDAFGAEGQTLIILPKKTVTRELAIFVARDVGEVAARVHKLRGETVAAITGSVVDSHGAAVRNARIIVLDKKLTGASAFSSTLSTDDAGMIAAELPPGDYTLIAEGENFARSAPVDVTVPTATPVALTLAAAGDLTYTVKDRSGAPLAAKISIVGAPASPPDARLRDIASDTLPYGIAAFRYSFAGDSSAPNGFDSPLSLAPGTYRVIVTKGPEWSRFEQVLTMTDAGAHVDVVLDRIIPTPGYVAADFHQHTYFSPDSAIPPEQRAVAYLAEGVEFISSSEHDTHYDYEPLLATLGVESQLDSSVGVECTPWDYGHFIGFPLKLDPMSPTGGALDWSAGEMGPNLAPSEIFNGMRALGAKVVQVNHPRAAPGEFSTFQKNFDRAGLHFDFAGHTFYGDESLQEYSAVALGLPDGAKLFGANFDAVEIFNGFRPVDEDTERRDQLVEINLRDWMNFLSFGFTPTPEGNSDSHSLYRDPSGVPRTLVRIPDDSANAISGGIADDVIATVAGTSPTPRDVVVSNTPFLQLTVDGKGIGSTVAHVSGPLKVHVEVKTPAWAPIDTVELFANETYTVPEMVQPFPPTICFTSRAVPSARCASAVGGARAMTINTVEVVAGQPQTKRLEVTIDVDLEVADLLSRQRAGAQGQDLWIVARTIGNVGLFPLVTAGLQPTDLPALVSTFDLTGKGEPAMAFTNAIFVDVDGNGWKAPFAP